MNIPKCHVQQLYSSPRLFVRPTFHHVRWSVQNIMQQERFCLDSRPKYPEKMVCRPWISICLPIMSMIPSPYFFQQPLSMVLNMWFRALFNHGFRGLFDMNGRWNYSLITPIIFSFFHHFPMKNAIFSSTMSGWWFHPPWKIILVSWGYYSQYMEK